MQRQRPHIKSRINKHKSRDDVVKAMDMKLSSGPELILSKASMARAQKISAFLSYGIIFGVLLFLGVFSIGIFKFVTTSPKSTTLTISAPVTTLDEDYANGAISADQYAQYLCCLLVRFNDLPEKYRGRLLAFDAQEILAKLKSVWPRLKISTQNEIYRFLPQIIAPQQESARNG